MRLCVQGAAKAEGAGPIADLFTKIEGFLSEDIVKSTQAVYQFEVTGGLCLCLWVYVGYLQRHSKCCVVIITRLICLTFLML